MTKLIFIGVLFTFIGKSFCGEVEDKFKEAQIVDDLIPEAPELLLQVGTDWLSTTLGKKFKPAEVRNVPDVNWVNSSQNEKDFFSLIMTQAGYKQEWIHWLVVNSVGSNFAKADSLVSFFPPTPTKGSGEHRYVFLLYKQPGKIDFSGYVKTSTLQMEGRDKFKTTSFAEKRFVLENMKLLIENSSLLELSFQSNLFKMQTDQLSFERFEELFESEDEQILDEPLFENEWKSCQNFFLHAEQAAVFVFTADVMEFINRTSETIKFFIQYKIKNESMTTTVTMNAGDIEIDNKMIFDSDTEMKVQKSEIYKDLLAVTSTSSKVELTVKFEQQLRENSFNDFLCQTLKFQQLVDDDVPSSEPDMTTFDFSKMNYTDMMEVENQETKTREAIFFYTSDKYFKGILVRLKVIDQLNIKLKVYIRSSHQIVTFARAIYCKYSERCSIDVERD